MEEEQPAAGPDQAGCMSLSACPSRDAHTGTGRQQEASQQEQADLLVHIECHQSRLWLWEHKRHRPVLKEVIVSFKRRPSEEPDRSLLQQQDGLEHGQPQSQGQDSSLRHPGALSDTPGQVSIKDKMGQPETGQDRTASLPWTMGYVTAQQPLVTLRRFTEGTINHQVLLEQLGAQAASSEPVASAKEKECEDAIGPELSEEEKWEDALDVEPNKEEWEGAVGTELYRGTDDIGSSAAHHWVNSLGMDDNKGSHTGPKEGPIVTPVAQEEPSLVGEEAAAFSVFLDTLAEATQMWHRKVQSILERALIAVQGKGQKKRQHSTGCKEVLPEPTQSMRAEGLDEEHPVKQGPGQQLVEEEPDLELSMKEAIEAGTPAGPAFRSPSPTVIDALAQERRTSIFQGVSRALLPKPFAATCRRGEQEQQQPTACARDVPDTAQSISSEVLSKARMVIQELKQREVQKNLEHSRDAAVAVRARAAGAVSPAHCPHSTTADGLALLDTAPYVRDKLLSKAVTVIQGSEEHMEEQEHLEQGTIERRVTTPAESTESPEHTVHSHTADAPVFLEYNDYTHREVVKEGALMNQKPLEYPEEKQDDELNTDGSTTAERLAGHAQSLPASTVISTPARERWLSQRVVRAVPLASIATSGTGKKEKKQLKADGMDLLDTEEYIRRDVQDKATLEIQGSIQQIVEQQDMELSRDVSPTVTPTTDETKSRPTADMPVFLNAADYIQTEAIKKAMFVVQRPLEEPEKLWKQEQSVDEETRAKARAAEAGRQTRVLHSPRTGGRVLLDTAQYIPAPAEGSESPGHTMHSRIAPVFLEYHDYIQTEVVKKAVLMVQKPFKYPEEEQDDELSAEGYTMAERLAGHAQSLPASTVINTPACVNTPAVEQQDMEHSRDVSPTVKPTTAGTKSHVCKTDRPTTDTLVFLDYNDFLWTESVKKAVLMVQKPFEYPEEPREREESMDKARAAERRSLAHACYIP